MTLCHWFPSPSTQPRVCISTPSHPSFSNSGLCHGYSSLREKSAGAHLQDDLYSLLAVNFQKKGLKHSLGPLPATAPPALLLCSSQSLKWQPLAWQVEPAQPGGSWAQLARLLLRDLAPVGSAGSPSLACLRTHPKLAQAPPPHPPHSRPQRLRSPAPLARAGAVVTCQLGEEVRLPGGCCLSH